MSTRRYFRQSFLSQLFRRPIISWILHRYGFVWSFHFTNFLGIAYNVISLIPNLEIQVIAALIYTFYRALVYSLSGMFAAHVFGPVNVGTILGLVYIWGAVTTLLIWPFTLISDKYLDGELTAVNASMMGLIIPTVIATEMIRSRMNIPGQDIKVDRTVQVTTVEMAKV